MDNKTAELIGNKVLQKLSEKIKIEFPSTRSEFVDFFKVRGYNSLLSVDFWDI